MSTQQLIVTSPFRATGFLSFLIGIFVFTLLLLILYAIGLPVLFGSFDFRQLLSYEGYFSAWNQFESPPSAIKRIISLDGNKVIWIETTQGNIYSKSFHSFRPDKNSPWKKQKEANFSTLGLYSEQFNSCDVEYAHNFEKTFRKPPGKVVQCARLEEAGGHYLFIWYFVLLEDGRLWVYQFWEDEFCIILIFCLQVTSIGIVFSFISRFFFERLNWRLGTMPQ